MVLISVMLIEAAISRLLTAFAYDATRSGVDGWKQLSNWPIQYTAATVMRSEQTNTEAERSRRTAYSKTAYYILGNIKDGLFKQSF